MPSLRDIYSIRVREAGTFNNSFRNEMARDEYLELGLFYAGVGLKEEAMKVLEQVSILPGGPLLAGLVE